MGYFKFEWNQDSASVDFDGNMIEFASNLSSYLMTAVVSENKREQEEATNIAMALNTAIYAYKAANKRSI